MYVYMHTTIRNVYSGFSIIVRSSRVYNSVSLPKEPQPVTEPHHTEKKATPRCFSQSTVVCMGHFSNLP